VDGHNVMGAAADGWWRDRPGATRRLLARISAYADATGTRVVLVFDVALDDVPEGAYGGVALRYATRTGRDAGDDRIRDLLTAGDLGDAVEVVTSDRALADSARAHGATVSGAGGFLHRLDAAGC
jgi:predicted RNA-binding protein with PIN domain